MNCLQLVVLLVVVFITISALKLTRGFLQDAAHFKQQYKTVIRITHSIDEALLLLDRIVMMRRSPSAKITKILEVSFPRPRSREVIARHPAHHQLKAEMEQHLCRETRTVKESRIITAA